MTRQRGLRMLNTWLADLEKRHLADLTFAEVARALRALSSNYVERRGRLARKTAFDSAGKRAAYALYYSPLHFLTVERIIERLKLDARPAHRILDVGCGAGAAGAAWASRLSPAGAVSGIDAHPWAIGEAAFTYHAFRLHADLKRGNITRIQIPRTADAIIAGWTLNELDPDGRALLQSSLLRAAAAGAQVLIVEPIATRVAPWWDDWIGSASGMDARADEWRFRVELPPLLRQLDRAAGLRHDQLTARSLYVSARSRTAGLRRPKHGRV
jgi:SAM-dependent methyltransferase